MAVPRAAADEELDESPEAVTKEVFKQYQCGSSRILEAGARSHNGDIAEPSSLTWVLLLYSFIVFSAWCITPGACSTPSHPVLSRAHAGVRLGPV
jgi:hypothetical protein